MNVRTWFATRNLETALQEALSGDLQTRVHAVRQLATAKDPRAIDALIIALEESKPVAGGAGAVSSVPEAAEESLKSMGSSASDSLRADVRVRLLALLSRDAQPRDGLGRLKAARILGYMGAADAVMPLIGRLNDPNGAVRAEVIHALSRIGRPAHDPLTAASKHDDPLIREGACDALAVLWRRAGINTRVPSPTPLTTAAHRGVVRRWYADYINHQNLAVLDELVTHDFRSHVPSGAPGTGCSALKQADAVLFSAFPDLRLTVKEIVAEGDMVAIRFASQGTHRGTFLGVAATGKMVTGSAMDIFRFADGKIAERWLEGDFLGFLQQVGVRSAPAQAHPAESADEALEPAVGGP